MPVASDKYKVVSDSGGISISVSGIVIPLFSEYLKDRLFLSSSEFHIYKINRVYTERIISLLFIVFNTLY